MLFNIPTVLSPLEARFGKRPMVPCDQVRYGCPPREQSRKNAHRGFRDTQQCSTHNRQKQKIVNQCTTNKTPNQEHSKKKRKGNGKTHAAPGHEPNIAELANVAAPKKIKETPSSEQHIQQSSTPQFCDHETN